MKSIMGEFWIHYRIEWGLFLLCRLQLGRVVFRLNAVWTVNKKEKIKGGKILYVVVYIYMYIYVDICVPRILYMYKISAHMFFKTLLVYIYIYIYI